jgi:hypothetical protein
MSVRGALEHRAFFHTNWTSLPREDRLASYTAWASLPAPAKTASGPSSSSIRRSWLYFASRSDWASEPDLDLPGPGRHREVGDERVLRLETVSLTELDPSESAPVLRDYVRAIRVVRPFFIADPDSALEAFAEEAARRPVFRLANTQAADVATSRE